MDVRISMETTFDDGTKRTHQLGRLSRVLSQSFFLKNIALLGPSFHHQNTERGP